MSLILPHISVKCTVAGKHYCFTSLDAHKVRCIILGTQCIVTLPPDVAKHFYEYVVAKHFYEYVVCLFVCLLIHSHNLKTTGSNFTKFFLHIALSHFCSDNVAVRYVFSVLWMMSCFYMAHIPKR